MLETIAIKRAKIS